MSRSPRLRLQSLIQAAAVTLFAASAAHAQQAVQWRVEDGGNGHWYQLRAAPLQSWADCAIQAQESGGSLATLTTPGENGFVVAAFAGSSTRYPWIGLSQAPDAAEPSTGWSWVTGEALSWSNWSPSEPNGDGAFDADQANLWLVEEPGRPRGTWNDWHTGGPDGFLVEWSADCNADGIVDYGQILDGTYPDSNADGVPDVCQQAPCTPSDLTSNGIVDGADLGALLAFWGPVNPVFPQADINRSGVVDGADLGTLLANWGPCVTPSWATVISWTPDPAVVTDPQLRASILATGLPWRVRDSGTGIEMLLVPPGTFQMGCSPSVQQACAPSESPVHQVTLTRAYYLGRYEVTQAQWVATMGSNPSTWPGAELPVNRVEREIISAFLNVTGTRLPTEAEWEWAYRAGTTTAFHGFDGQPGGTNDDALLPSIAWCSANSGGQTRAVGGKPGNGFGLHDMSGNVSEWVQAWWAEYPSTPQVDPTGPTSPPPQGCIVIRGGSWADGASAARSSARSACGVGAIALGFRVARNP